MFEIAVVPNLEPGCPQDMGLRLLLKAEGILWDPESREVPSSIVVENASTRNMREFRKMTRRFPESHTVLVRTEPQVVIPGNFSKKTLALFDHTFTLGGDPNLYGHTAFYWPQIWRGRVFRESLFEMNRKDSFAIINANKLSFVEGENYSLRRMAVKCLKSIYIYGEGWDSNFFRRARKAGAELLIALMNRQRLSKNGLRHFFKSFSNSFPPVPDKFQTLREFKYSIVIENSNAYMSEKLFDAFFAGTIPIYVGPNPEAYGIPPELFVYCKPTLEDLQVAMIAVREIDYDNWLIAVDGFLSSHRTSDQWESQRVFAKVASEITRLSTPHVS